MLPQKKAAGGGIHSREQWGKLSGSSLGGLAQPGTPAQDLHLQQLCSAKSDCWDRRLLPTVTSVSLTFLAASSPGGQQRP